MASSAKKCCSDCPCACPCADSLCWQLQTPPEGLTVCNDNAAALALLNGALSGVLKNHSGAETDPCDWWSTRCGDIGGGVYAGYSIAMHLDSAQCKMILDVWQACNFNLTECCSENDYDRPPYRQDVIEWERVVVYECRLDDFEGVCTNDHTFIKKLEAGGCDSCSGGVDGSQFPDELIVEDVTCDDSIPGGSECEGEEFDDCCGISTRSGNLFVTITSSCPQFDGLTLTLQRSGITWFSLGAVLGTEPLASDCHGDNLNGTCKIDSLILICDPSDGSWSFTMAGSCQMDPSGSCSFTMVNSSTDLLHDAPPDTITCDPLSMTFTKYIYEPGGSPCSGCVTCEITLTVTE